MYTQLLYARGFLFLLVFAAWLAISVYLYLLHKRYAHIPSLIKEPCVQSIAERPISY